MKAILQLLLLPLQAPMLIVLLIVSAYEGAHWDLPFPPEALPMADTHLREITALFLSIDCVQALVVVILCTMPDVLMSRITALMEKSRVITLVLALLLVTVSGLYLLNIEALANVLILGSAVLLARLDLVRIQVVPPSWQVSLSMCLVVLGGASLGRLISLP